MEKHKLLLSMMDNKPVRIDTVVISTQHDEKVSQEQIRRDLIEHVIKPIIPTELLDEEY